MNNCIVNNQGELLEILQTGQEKELQQGQSLVPIHGYYEVRNEQRYDSAVWDFSLKKWVGLGQQRPVLTPKTSEIEILQAKLNSATQQLDFQEELIVDLAMKVYQ